MQYVSTRGGAPKVGFETVLFSGYAPDGGLYVPEKLPDLSWRHWKDKSYKGIVKELVASFLSQDLPLDDLVNEAYSNFTDDSVAKILELDDNLKVLELFHGPTWAFKDYSLAFVGPLMQHCLRKRNRRQMLLVATSGDTGGAAMEAVKNKPNIEMIVLMPTRGRISEIQHKQMSTIDAPNVHLYECDASSDYMDEVLRSIFTDKQMSQKYNIGSVNSINWVRILIQMAHWFYAYLHIFPADSQEMLCVAVPSGGCGNITAGLFAAKTGLPVRIVACTNKNDVTHQLIQTGTLRKADVMVSLAPAMDIQAGYNVERMLYLVSGGDCKLISDLMVELSDKGSFTVSPELHEKLNEFVVGSHRADDNAIKNAIQHSYKKFAYYYACPHSATALSYAYSAAQEGPLLCIATAAPDKFLDLYPECDVPARAKSQLVNNLLAKAIKTPHLLNSDSKSKWAEIIREKIVEICD